MFGSIDSTVVGLLRATRRSGLVLAASVVLMTSMPQSALGQVNGNGANGEVRLDTVMIGATRRQDATVQNVPIALNAFEAQILEDANVQTIADIEQIAPSVQINQRESVATGTKLNIRGIGTASNNPGFESAVGVFVDGVYRSRPGIALGELTDLERIEVLRGPQGTLFGKNTSAGAITVETQKPEFEQRGYVEGHVGDFDAVGIGGMITGPVTNTIALRLDAKYREREGYIEDVNSSEKFNTIDRWVAKAQALFDDGVQSLRLIADYAETDELCCAAVNTSQGATAPIIQAVAAQSGVQGFANRSPSDLKAAFTPGRIPTEKVEEWGLSAQYDRRFDVGNFTSITGYRDWQVERGQDVDFTGLDRAYRDGYMSEITTFTQEFRLQNEVGRLDWLVGLFFASEELNLRDTVRSGADSALYVDSVVAAATADPTFLPNGFQFYGSLGPQVPLFSDPALPFAGVLPASAIGVPLAAAGDGQGQQADRYSVETQTVALFTHNEYAITEDLNLTVGLRLNTETKDFDADLDAVLPGCDFLLDPNQSGGLVPAFQAQGIDQLLLLPCPLPGHTGFDGRYSRSRDEDEWTGTVKLAYNVNPNFRIYGSVARGYKAGGFTLDRTSFDTVLIAGGDGPQVEDLEFEPEFVNAFEAGWKSEWYNGRVTMNGAVFHETVEDYQYVFFQGDGFEVINVDEVTSMGVEVDAAAKPTDNLTIAGGFAFNQVEIEKAGANADPFVLALEGDQLPNIPELTLAGSITYDMPIAETGYTARFHLNGRYNDAHEVDPISPEPNRNGSYAVFDARVGIRPRDNRWSLDLVADNITDENYFLAGFPVAEAGPNPAFGDPIGTTMGYPASPRFVGIEGRINF